MTRPPTQSNLAERLGRFLERPTYVCDETGIARRSSGREKWRIRWDELLSVRSVPPCLILYTQARKLRIPLREVALTAKILARVKTRQEEWRPQPELDFEYPRSAQIEWRNGVWASLIVFPLMFLAEIMKVDGRATQMWRGTASLLRNADDPWVQAILWVLVPGFLGLLIVWITIVVTTARMWWRLRSMASMRLTASELCVRGSMRRWKLSSLQEVMEDRNGVTLRFADTTRLQVVNYLSDWDLFRSAVVERARTAGARVTERKPRLNWWALSLRCVIYAALIYLWYWHVKGLINP